MSVFHVTQALAATNIHEVFTSGAFHYALLCAEMQSGKTGAFQSLARQSLQSGLVERVYILCGSAEVVLKRQAIDDTQTYNADLSDRITVCFRQDFPKTTLNTRSTLLIVDESHLDSSHGQQMMLFLARHGLTLQGTTPEMVANGTYICSVSATPYAELAKIRDGSSLPKHVEYLQPGPGYYGLQHYEADGLLRPTFSIAADSDRFRALLVAAIASPKWILMRTVDTETMETVRALCSILGMPILEYNATRKDVAITRAEAIAIGLPATQSLDDAPTTTSIVHIKGTCRVGKVLPKRHIAFVWEDSKAPSTDTSVQALPGRMCGYASAFGPEKPVIYVSSKVLEGRKTVLTLDEGDDNFTVSELDRHSALTIGREVVPTKGMNVTRSTLYKRDEDAITQTPPFLLDMTDVPAGTRLSESVILARLKATENQLMTQYAWALLTEEQQAEITTFLARPASELLRDQVGEGRPLHYRRLKTDSADGNRDKFVDVTRAYVAQTSTHTGWNLTQTSLLFHVVESIPVTLPLPTTVRPGHIYCVFYTHAPPRLEALPLRSRVPETKPDTVFDSFTLTEELIHAAATVGAEYEDDDDDVFDVPAPLTPLGGAGFSSSASVISALSGITLATSDPLPAPVSPVSATTDKKPTTAVATDTLSYWCVPLPPDATTNPALMREFLLANIQGTSGTRDIKPAFPLNKTSYHYTGSQKKNNDFCAMVRDIGTARGLKVTFDCGTGPDYDGHFYVKKVTWTSV